MVVAAKVLGRIIITRIRDGIDNKLRQEQAGFRKGRGTTEQIFILRNIIEQCIESGVIIGDDGDRKHAPFLVLGLSL